MAVAPVARPERRDERSSFDAGPQR